MNFGEQPNSNEQDAEKVKIIDTASFQEAIYAENLEQAEAWLNNIKANPPENYNDRWIDQRERELFRAYHEAGDYVSAKRIVESSINAASKTTRIARLAEVSGQAYESI